MNELDHLDTFIQADSQGRLARATHTSQRAEAAAAAAEAFLHASGLQPVPAHHPVTLVLPPELQAIGALAVYLCEDKPVTLAHSLVSAGAQPHAELRVGDRTFGLGPHAHADAHPAQTLLVLLGLLAALYGETPFPLVNYANLEALSRCHAHVPAAENPAKQLALRVHEHIPCFWGAGLEAAAARDWVTRLLWNAESMALAIHQDELSRLQVMARFPRFWPNAALFVHLTTPDASGPLVERVGRILARRRFSTVELAAPAPISSLDRALYWLELGEWIALYAAALNNVDPAAQVPLDILFDEV